MAGNVVFGSGEVSLGALTNLANRLSDATSTSLFQFARKSMINSSVFIERTLVDEPVLKDLMSNIMNLYVGLIMTAMDLNRFVNRTQRVRDLTSVVSTEHFTEMPADVDLMMDNYFGLPTMAVTDRVSIPGVSDKLKELHKEVGPKVLRDDVGRSAWDKGPNVTSSKIIDSSIKEANLPSGRIIEITMADSATDNRLTVHLLLQLMPRFVPTEVAQAFISLNFTPTLKQRWMQRGAGEISFFKDFLLSHDLRSQRLRALTMDKSGALQEMLDKQKNSLFKMWMKRAMLTPEKQNIANTILIFDKRSFDNACQKAGFDFRSYNNRQRFFDKTFAMMLCTVDPMYNKVGMYYHGLPAVSEFTFEQIKKSSKTDAMDVLSVMKQYANGMAPKF